MMLMKEKVPYDLIDSKFEILFEKYTTLYNKVSYNTCTYFRFYIFVYNCNYVGSVDSNCALSYSPWKKRKHNSICIHMSGSRHTNRLWGWSFLYWLRIIQINQRICFVHQGCIYLVRIFSDIVLIYNNNLNLIYMSSVFWQKTVSTGAPYNGIDPRTFKRTEIIKPPTSIQKVHDTSYIWLYRS